MANFNNPTALLSQLLAGGNNSGNSGKGNGRASQETITAEDGTYKIGNSTNRLARLYAKPHETNAGCVMSWQFEGVDTPRVVALFREVNRDIIDQELIDQQVVIVGVGAIGSQLAEQLAKMGVRRFILLDPDCVSPENLSVQGFYEDELYAAKVHAVFDRIKRINSQTEVTCRVGPWTSDKSEELVPADSVIFSCVDSMNVRRRLYETEFGRRRQLAFFDGRMAAENLEVYCVTRADPDSIAEYRKSLFPQAEMFQESCTAKATIYCASIAAGILTALYKQWAMREKTGYFARRFEFNIRTLDVLCAELTI